MAGSVGGEIPGLRKSDVRWVSGDDANFTWLFGYLKQVVEHLNAQYFHFALDNMEPIQLGEYRADAEHHYGAHVDCSYDASETRRRKLSLTIQLSEPDAYQGGDLLLYPETKNAVTANRRRGSMTMFRSHILHEVTPVTAGVRDSLVAWISGPDWS